MRLRGRLQQITGQIEQHGRVRRLVPMHLRPQQNALRAGADFSQIDRPAFDGLGEFFDLQTAGGRFGELFQDALDIAARKRGGVQRATRNRSY